MFHDCLRDCLATTLLLAGLLVACGGSSPTTSLSPTEGKPWFPEVTDEMKLDFTHSAGTDGSYYMPEIMGAGGALLDYDRDGDLDIYLVQGGPHPPAPPDPKAAANRLYRHEPDSTFTRHEVRARVFRCICKTLRNFRCTCSGRIATSYSRLHRAALRGKSLILVLRAPPALGAAL